MKKIRSNRWKKERQKNFPAGSKVEVTIDTLDLSYSLPAQALYAL
jgi:hypothetical protein